MGTFPEDRLSKLTLGTVQLGMPYGYAVKTHPPSPAQRAQLLNTAYRSGITCFDTAQAYGNAEPVLGQWLNDPIADYAQPLLVSKFPQASDAEPGAFVRDAARRSLAALGRERIDAYLAHHPEDIFDPTVTNTLRTLCAEGAIGSFGVSVYEPTQLEKALQMDGLSVVQVPASLLDQRFQEDGLLQRCADQGVTVFARSIFLQGVLLMPVDQLPASLAPAATPIAALQTLAAEIGCPLESLALAAVLSMPGVRSAVVGVANETQLRRNIAAFENMPGQDAAQAALAICETLPLDVIDPRRWT
tara:strand:+ start:849 stop:1754 length:906 start_codon:yes stop_codon:yes gene_type:complete